MIKNLYKIILRDYFAGQALMGQCYEAANFKRGFASWEEIAKCAYNAADAMIKIRSLKDKEPQWKKQNT